MSLNILSKLKELNFDNPHSIKDLTTTLMSRRLTKERADILIKTNNELLIKSQEEIVTLDNNQIVNYILLEDNKSISFEQINEKFLQTLNNHKLDIEMISVLYTNHLSFTINNENNFSKDIYYNLLKDDNYLNLKRKYLEFQKYIDTFVKHNECSFNLIKEEEEEENKEKEEKEKDDIINYYQDTPFKTQIKTSLSHFKSLSSSLSSPLSPLKSSSLSSLSSLVSPSPSPSPYSIKLPFISKLSPLKSSSSSLSLSPLSDSSESNSLTKKLSQELYKYNRTPKKSIFFKILPKDFAKSLNKLSLSLFYLIDIAEFEYISKDEKRHLENIYNIYYSNFYPNILSNLLKEVEIYCEFNKIKLLFNNFKECIEYFFKVHNIPLIKIFIGVFPYFDSCLSEIKIYISDVEKRLREIKDTNKYMGLTPGYNIKTKFIGILSNNDSFEKKLDKLEKTINIITDTKIIISKENFKEKLYTECIIFEFVKPDTLINIKLYKSHTSGQIQCIKDKCE